MSSARKTAPRPNTKSMQQSVQRWGAAAIDNGWSILPNTLLKYQYRLEIDPVELNVILQILQYWWGAKDLPFPSQRTIAESMGRDRTTVQRVLKRLRDRGLIEAKVRLDPFKGQRSNYYCFDGLIAKIAELAEADLQEKRQHEQSQRQRKRPVPKYASQLSVYPEGE